jgi:hypothetical protein
LGSSVGTVLWNKVLATDLVQMFLIRRKDHTFHLDCFAETLEVVGEEGGIGKEVRVSSFSIYVSRTALLHF